jgi:hypothetical protein
MLSLSEHGMKAGIGHDSGGEQLKVVCGFLGCDARPFNPLLASMPRVMILPGMAAEGSSWVANFLHSMVDESTRKRPGGEAVLERMSEMLFVEALRCFVETLPAGETGWLAGMRDPSIGRVLALLHEQPEAPWTLKSTRRRGRAFALDVAREFAISSVSRRCSTWLIGACRWRPSSCATRSRSSSRSRSASATTARRPFSRAFKRAVGVAPGAWRGGQRAGAKVKQVAP